MNSSAPPSSVPGRTLTRFLFFTGKGGVGKTSHACATAVALADDGRRVLLVSTDPASNLAEVLGTPVGELPTPIDGVPGLMALNIDPEAAASYGAENGKDPAELYRDPEVVSSIEAHVDEVNEHLAPVQQVKKIRILPKDLSQEGNELTPTLKLKRPVIAEKYDAEIEELYAK
jgi:cellulose biosynthesis protein BcsQ